MHLVNEEIKNTNVKLVGEFSGEMSLEEALEVAYSNDLDLVEMSVVNGVSICKVMNYSKFLYEQKKAKKVQKKMAVKDIKFGCNIADHDLKISHKKATNILKEGDRVRVMVVFKGRQSAYASTVGADLIDKFLNLFDEDAIQIVSSPKLEGNTYTVTLENKKVSK